MLPDAVSNDLSIRNTTDLIVSESKPAIDCQRRASNLGTSIVSSCCPFSNQVIEYVNCTLNEVQSDDFDSHLSGCATCNQQVAQLIDCGIGPAWLAELRQIQSTTDNRLIQTIDYRTDDERLPKSLIEGAVDLATSDDRYHFVRLHGEGGMGHVWEGWDKVMHRRVALKQLRASHRQDELNRRLIQEASSLARLSHPNIVTVFEVLMLKQQPTLVMEFIHGPNLSRQRKDTVMGERQAAKIVERLADAMAHAHEQGVIHRDLKPSNVLLQWPVDKQSPTQELDRAVPKLTDFGLAKLLEGDDLTRTAIYWVHPLIWRPSRRSSFVSFGTRCRHLWPRSHLVRAAYRHRTSCRRRSGIHPVDGARTGTGLTANAASRSLEGY